MEKTNEFWMAERFLAAANQAAHEWFAHMEGHGARVLMAFEQTTPVSASAMARYLNLTIPEADALALACSLALREILGKGAAQTTEDRLYRRALVDVLGQLSKNPTPYAAPAFAAELEESRRLMKGPVVG